MSEEERSRTLRWSEPVVCRHGVPGHTLRVTGPERTSWLNGLVTCDVREVSSERAAWGLALNRTGKIQSVIWVVAREQALLLGVSQGTGEHVLAEFDRMLVMEDCEIEDESESFEWALHLALGPPVGAGTAPVAASPVAVSPVGASIELLGLGERALVLPKGEVTSNALAGAAELDEASWRLLRLERGLPEFGIDYGTNDRPHEATLERRAVDWSKGCYLGQEVVCMQDMRGKVSRSVQRLLIGAPHTARVEPGTELVDGAGSLLGKLTSVAFSERAGAFIGMAQLPLARVPELAHARVGRELFGARSTDVVY